MSVSRIDDVGITELGEGPHWDQPSKSLFFVDIRGKSIHKYTPSSGKHYKAIVGDEQVGFVVPVEGKHDKFVVGTGRKVVLVTWDGISDRVSDVEVITEIDTEGEAAQNRINDGKCDPLGRLWFGTMGPEPVNGQIAKDRGSLFSIDSKRSHTSRTHPVSISNGLAWSADRTKFYYIDSLRFCVDEFDYDMKTGKICNRKPIFTFSKHGIEGIPDGMTIDSDGNLWVAVFNGCKVLKIDPRKPDILLQTVELPAKQITSVAFGGEYLDDLYVTSARITVDNQVLPAPVHGALYKITGLGVKGVPMDNFKC